MKNCLNCRKTWFYKSLCKKQGGESWSTYCCNEWEKFTYEEKLISKLKYYLEKKTSQIMDIFTLNEEGKSNFGGKYCIVFYFNDMVAYATSWCSYFIPKDKNNTVQDIYLEFDKWLNLEGYKILEKLDSVKYPEAHNEEKKYFNDNYEIVKELEISLNKYCGNDLLNE